MRRDNIIKFIPGLFAALAMGFILPGCGDSGHPSRLDFGDIYGREEWNTEEDYPAGYFYIDRYRDMTLEKTGGSSPIEGGAATSGEMIPDSYKLTFTGPEPYFATQRLLKQLSVEAVLSFTYACEDDVDAWVTLQTLNGSVESRIFPLEASPTERDYSFDLGMLIEDGAWGGVASLIQLRFSGPEGTEIAIRNIRVRSRNGTENSLKNRFWVGPPYLPGENTAVEDIAEYRTYGYESFAYIPTNDGGWQTTQLYAGYLTESLPRNWDKISFEFRTEEDLQLTINWYFVEDGAALFVMDADHNGIEGPTDGWKKITVDLNGLPGQGGPANGTATGLLNDIYNAGLDPLPRYLRWHVNSGGPNRIEFRGICFHE